MKVLLLGATGRTGSWVLDKALGEGHQVQVLSRDVQRLKPRTGLKIRDGNPREGLDLEIAISKCDAVISVLNISRNSDFPWSKLRTPETYLSDVMRMLISVTRTQRIRRVIVCSAWGVSETRSDLPWWFRWLIDHSNIRYAYA